MVQSIGVIGAGVSGLTCAVVLAERGYRTAIFAEQCGQRTNSAVAAAIWYPYDAAPTEKIIEWALQTYRVLIALAGDANTGVSVIELHTFARAGEIPIPEWAIPLGARPLSNLVTAEEVFASSDAEAVNAASGLGRDRARRGDYSLMIPSELFTSGFTLDVPLTDTTIYLDYLAQRFIAAGGEIHADVRLAKLEDVSRDFDLVVNCAGIGAKKLVHDPDLEPHRGQVVIVPKLDVPCAVVCDDAPLMYAIPRANDCVLGGTNELSENREVDALATSRILAECSRILNIDPPQILAERVGLRPFRRSGVRLSHERLSDGRPVIHNYGHGGSGFTLSWGCAQKVLSLAEAAG